MNDELHARNEELTRVNADLLNLLASVQIAIVIVARDLRVRRFTPMAEKKFNLIPSDIGRSFSQISTTLQCPELPTLITETIDTVSPVERTVQDNKGETVPAAHPPVQDAGQPHRRRGYRAFRPRSRAEMNRKIGRWEGSNWQTGI